MEKRGINIQQIYKEDQMSKKSRPESKIQSNEASFLLQESGSEKINTPVTPVELAQIVIENTFEEVKVKKNNKDNFKSNFPQSFKLINFIIVNIPA